MIFYILIQGCSTNKTRISQNFLFKLFLLFIEIDIFTRSTKWTEHRSSKLKENKLEKHLIRENWIWSCLSQSVLAYLHFQLIFVFYLRKFSTDCYTCHIKNPVRNRQSFVLVRAKFRMIKLLKLWTNMLMLYQTDIISVMHRILTLIRWRKFEERHFNQLKTEFWIDYFYVIIGCRQCW